MALRKKIGDVFVINVDKKYKRYFQYLGVDNTELGSHVIRVFKKDYGMSEDPNLDDIARGEVDFHAHVILQFGVKLNIWKKVGSSSEIQSNVDVIFRTISFLHDSSLLLKDPQRAVQLTDAKQKVSENWSIWRMNEPLQFVGKLPEKYYGAETGGVVPPQDILYHIKHGHSNFVYPGY